MLYVQCSFRLNTSLFLFSLSLSLSLSLSVVVLLYSCLLLIDPSFGSQRLAIFATRISENLLPLPALAHAMPKPVHGDRILVLKPHWLYQILSGKKTLEIRGRRLKPGPCFLGCAGKIYASAEVAAPFPIEDTAEWIALRQDHGVQSDALPYRKTWGLPIKKLKHLKKAVPYAHKKGDVGIVRYDDFSCPHH